MKSLLVVIALAAGCEVSTTPPEPTPTPVPEAEPTDCERACVRLRELNCEMGAPDEEGNTCETVCEETQKAGLIDLKPADIAEGDSCP